MDDLNLDLLTIINALDVGVIELNENHNIKFYNKKTLSILEIDEDENSKSKILKFLEDQDFEYISNKDNHIKSIKYKNNDIIIERKLIIEKGKVKKRYIFLSELYDCKYLINKFDEELELLSLLNTMIEVTNDAWVYVNKDGNIRILSKPYAEFLGIKREDAIGKHVSEVIENTRMDIVLKTKKSEIAHVQEIDGKNMVATRIPVFVKGKLVGAIGKVLFRDVDELNNLYKKINNIEKELNLYKDEFKKANRATYELESIVSKSKSMAELKELTKKAAKTNSNILILGESGTGKELFAHSIHNNSKRKNNPFIKVNCGSIPYDLLESELFGYEEGSFTGAKKGGKIGKFKAADTGTIFLDEIGDLPMNMQVKILRVLQDKEIERIGSNYSEKIDVRIISATNKNLDKMVEEEKFRLDLYFRLNVVNICIPPLRERKEDISILANYLMKKISKDEGIKVTAIENSAIECLNKYDWPGNVRELENIIERAINFLENETIIKPEHLPGKITSIVKNKDIKDLKTAVEELERQSIIDSIILTKGNKSKAAEKLKISRTTLYEKMLKYDIDI